MDVTLVTANATKDDLSEQDYRDIFAELRGSHTLRQFVALSGTVYSISWWSQFEAGVKPLTYRAKCDLRRAVGLPVPAMPIGEAVEGNVDPDAQVYVLDGQAPAEWLLLATTQERLTVHWDGADLHVEQSNHVATTADVTGVTRTQARKAYWRPCLPEDLRLRCERAGLDVRQVIEEALIEATIRQYTDGG